MGKKKGKKGGQQKQVADDDDWEALLEAEASANAASAPPKTEVNEQVADSKPEASAATPAAGQDAAIGIRHLALPVRLACLPLALILVPIGKSTLADSMVLPVLPLASIFGAVLHAPATLPTVLTLSKLTLIAI